MTVTDTSLDFFSAAATPMALVGPDGTITQANPAWAEVIDGPSVVGATFASLVHEGDRAAVAAALAALAPSAPATIDVRLASPAEAYTARTFRLQATRHPSGTTYIVAVASPPGRMGDAFRLHLFDEVLSSAPVGILAIGADGTITASEGRLQSITGHGVKELIGQNALEKWKDAPFSAQIRRAIGGERFSHRSTGEVPSGRMHFQTWHFPITGGGGGAILFTLDITREASAEEALSQKLKVIEEQSAAQRLLGRALHSAPLILWSLDADGVCTMSEGKGLELLGASAAGMVGKSVFDLFQGNDELIGAVVRALGGEDMRATTSLAPGVTFETWYMPVRSDDGTVTGAMGLSIDATERVKSEQEVRHKLELIERQSATIRELATPIIQVWDGILCLPIIGTLDSARTADMMQGLLEAIVREHARYAIVDLTGVEVVDTSTADHLIQLFRAARVLGVDGILCGIRPAVAQTVVSLGLELGSVRTMRSLRDALKWCIRLRRGAEESSGNGGGLARLVNSQATSQDR